MEIAKETQVAILKTLINQLEQKRVIGEVDERVWLSETMVKSSDKNLAAHQQTKMMNALLDKQIRKAKELLAEVAPSGT